MELEDLFKELGVEPPAATPPASDPTPPATDPPADPEPAPTGNNGDNGGATPPEPADPTPTPEPEPPKDLHKQNKAFAELRTQNQQYLRTIKSLGELLGAQEVNDPNAILNLVQEKIVQAQAKQQNIPVDLLQRLNTLEAENQSRQQQALQQNALIGFQNVKKQFDLQDADLDKFADELTQNGINPFVQQVDLINVYKNIHFDEIVQKRIEKELAAERERALKAATQSTTPSNTNGGTPTPSSQIKTASDLEKWFNQNTK